MNIFYVNTNPYLAASDLVDKHVVKMILESAQLLSTALVLNDIEAPYKKTHHNHPSAIWTRESITHYDWLLEHLEGLCFEFSYRYEKHHKTANLLKDFQEKRNALKSKIGSATFVPPTCAMPNHFKITDDSLENYRYYYAIGKKHIFSWKKRDMPSWIMDYRKNFYTKFFQKKTQEKIENG